MNTSGDRTRNREGGCMRSLVCSGAHASSLKRPTVMPQHLKKCRATCILSSRQILGPMTLAAPEVSRNARCLGGHGADRPHLYLRGRGSAGEKVIALNAQIA